MVSLKSLLGLRRQESPSSNPTYMAGDIVRARRYNVGARGYGRVVSPEEFYQRTGNVFVPNPKPEP